MSIPRHKSSFEKINQNQNHDQDNDRNNARINQLIEKWPSVPHSPTSITLHIQNVPSCWLDKISVDVAPGELFVVIRLGEFVECYFDAGRRPRLWEIAVW